MKQSIFIFVLLLASLKSQAQSTSQGKSCSVVLLNNEWLIKSYERSEKIQITQSSKGLLSVHETGDLKNKSFKNEMIPFMVAILQKSDDTMIMFSDVAVREIELNEILKKCKAGDRINIILMDGDKYSLPHHQLEIL